MKKLRGIVLAGGTNYENFHECLKNVQRPFEQACTDLRSQVVREACITLAFLSQSLKTKFASFGEAVLLTLMNLIQNSAKVSSRNTRSLLLHASLGSDYYPNRRIGLCVVPFPPYVCISFIPIMWLCTVSRNFTNLYVHWCSRNLCKRQGFNYQSFFFLHGN